MPKQRTTKSNYPSLYSPQGWVTAAQYIIEVICEHKAKAEGRDLPVRFWLNEQWAKYYKMQLRACHKLLKQFDEKAIIRALKDPRSKKTYSLMAPWLVNIIVEKQALLNQEQENLEKLSQVEVKEETAGFTIRKPLNKGKSILDKLEGL
jgi:hypothetical protein